MDALRDVGIEVTSVYDLVNTTNPYTRALPILLEHLQRPYPERIREGIARAMAVPESKFAWETLLRLFRRDFDSAALGAKFGVGLALAAAADDEVIQDVIALFRDRRHGMNRSAFVNVLKRSRDASARAALEDAREDPQLGDQVRRAIGRRGSSGRSGRLESLTGRSTA